MKHCISFILFFLITLGCKAQTINQANNFVNLRCIYSFKFKTDSLSDAIRLDTQLLESSPKLSRYASKGQLAADSLLTVFSLMPFNQASADFYNQQRSKLPPNRTSFIIYKIKSSGIVRFYDKIAIKSYFYEETPPLFNWKISGEKATVAGYSCQLATTAFAGRVWTAWFTREIPVSDGPYKFYGLPGLIIKVGDAKSNFSFELVGLSRPKDMKLLDLPQPSKYTKASKLDFRKGREADRLNGLSQMANTGEVSINDKEKMQAMQSSRARRPFNPIELK